MKWGTSARYTHGRGECHPLTAGRIRPTYEDEDDVLVNILYMFTEGDFSCDCNKALFLADALQEERPENYPCGDSMKIKKMLVKCPDERELLIFDNGEPI